MSGIPGSSQSKPPTVVPSHKTRQVRTLPFIKNPTISVESSQAPPPIPPRNWSAIGIAAFGAVSLTGAALGYGLSKRQSGVKNGLWVMGRFGNVGSGTGGFSIQDATTNLMTGINSAVRIFYAFATHQHVYETFGYEGLNRVGTIQLVRLIKDEEKSPFSLARLGLDALMKPRNVVRQNDYRATSFLTWLGVNWQNSVKNRIQAVAGLNTPFEIMVKGLKKAPATPGDLKHNVVDAHYNRLSLKTTEEVIYQTLEKTEALLKRHEAAHHAFQQACQATNPSARQLEAAYHALATAQFELNQLEHPRQPEHWRGHQARKAYQAALGKRTTTPPDQQPLAVQQLHRTLEAHPPHTEPKAPKADEAYVDWGKLLKEQAKHATRTELQAFRHDLKLNYIKPEVMKVFKSLLVDMDGKASIPKNMGQKVDEVLFPYMKEATKYYNPAHFQNLDPDYIPAYRMDMLSDAHIKQLCDFIVLQAGSTTHLGKRNNKDVLKRYEKQVGQLIGSWVENGHETYNLLANRLTDVSVANITDSLNNAVDEYLAARCKSPKTTLGYFVSEAFQKGRYTEKNAKTGKLNLVGDHFKPVDAAFHLNKRLEDIDQYRRNRSLKLAAQIAFQTALSAFVLGNVLFFVVYNSFAHLDPDYQGESTPVLANTWAKLKAFFGNSPATGTPAVPPTPLEAKVNISVNFNQPLHPYGKHFSDASPPSKVISPATAPLLKVQGLVPPPQPLKPVASSSSRVTQPQSSSGVFKLGNSPHPPINHVETSP